MNKNLTLDKLFQATEAQAKACMGKTFVGIDFGTSTTVVSIAYLTADNTSIESRTIQLSQLQRDGTPCEDELLPSVIAIAPNKKLLVGQGAYSLKWNPDYIFGENIWHSFKMELGKDLGPKWFASKQAMIKSPQDATRIFFKFLKKQIESYCQESGLSMDIRYAVSIPASFESNQRKDLLDALKANDIEISGHNLIDEPNAAFLGYINKDDYYKDIISIPEEYNPKVLVFDFGAGTCDISILELGIDYKGFNTRNISISQFTELGGNDIDRHIAETYLLPELLKRNNADRNDFTAGNIELIVTQLMGAAEMLKIQASRAFDYFMTDQNLLEEMIKKGESISVTTPVIIETGYGELRQSEFSLKYSQFRETMKKFYKKNPSSWLDYILPGKRQSTIESVVDSAIEKAHVKKSEVDYVMMVGGSSKNPFVRNELKKSFGNCTTMLLPKNMQTLVSQGASIHSLLVNGLGITAVKPITSEPIVVVVRGEEELPIIPAGTQIPFAPVVIDNFTTGDKSQSTIEIPICVTSAKKVLCTVKIANPYGECFPKNEPIKLTLEMTADKVLSVSAECDDTECVTTTENPFSNTYMTDDEKKILSAQRASNVSACNNSGRPTRQSLCNLRQAYIDADKDYEAAETLVDELRYYPQDNMYNYIGVLYHNGGDKSKAIKYYKKAIEVDARNHHAWANLGHDLWLLGKNDEAKEALDRAIEIKGDNYLPLIVLGRILNEEDDKEGAEKVWNQAYTLLNRKWKNGEMVEVDFGWFISVARALGYDDIVEEIEARRPKKTKSSLYNVENLITITKRTQE